MATATATVVWVGPFEARAAEPGQRLSLRTRAQTDDSPAAAERSAAEDPDAPDASDDASRKQAEDLFAEGEAAYQRGDFGDAADRFARAQALAPHPATLYNLGMARSSGVLATCRSSSNVS